MAAITIHSDFGAQENKICHCFHFLPLYFHEVMGPDAMILAPRPGITPAPPALEGDILSPGLPEKSSVHSLW